ncbi:putative centromere-associated protein E isoform X2 [Iris pallida]|uniref:Centromere-associated protein E isoform X2 n=1 Tax=Iris pallida TaxID=29817 RepID=A0AAX6HG86_IRIPA|nr:putative centromere-associated protein E isoform X2 [Iris pallida]
MATSFFISLSPRPRRWRGTSSQVAHDRLSTAFEFSSTT